MLTDTIHQALISHTGTEIPILSLMPFVDCSLTVYTYTITNWGNQNFLGEVTRYVVLCSAHILHIRLPTLGYRTLVVEVLFNVCHPIATNFLRPLRVIR